MTLITTDFGPRRRVFHASNELAFRRHTDYAYAGRRYRAPGLWERVLRAVGFRFWRFE